MGATEEAYKSSFGMGTPPDKDKQERALDRALDIRKFEIGLYWQRAAYFWTLIAATFAGYFAILSADLTHLPDKDFLAFIISCIGSLFTWAWCLVNRGSKQWQENWENHVDMLEDGITGPLYKTVLLRPKGPGGAILLDPLGPGPFSVSRINQLVSYFTLLIWIFLIYRLFPKVSCCSLASSKEHILVSATTFLFAVLMWFGGRTDQGTRRVIAMKTRTTKIGDE